MSAPIPLSEWVRIVRPSGAQSARLLMLTAYFDDSGTHENGKTVVWAGFMAPEENWLRFDAAWRAVLTRENLSHFHMAKCSARQGPYERWARADCDRVIHDLRQAIKEAELFGIGMAVSIPDWHEVIDPHPLGSKFGTPEEFAWSGCFYHALNLAQDFRLETDVSLVFDDRDRITNSMNRIVEHYRRQAKESPRLVSVSFQKCSRFCGLQAADMLAWETYQHALNWVSAGRQLPARPHFQDLLDYGRLKGTFMNRERLLEQISSAVPRMD